MQRNEFVLQFTRSLPLAGQRQVLHLGHQLGGHVGRHRDTTLTAADVVDHGGGIFTGEPGERLLDQLALHPGAGQIAGRILHPGDARQLGQAGQGRRLHVDDRARRDVVDDDGLAGGVVHRLEVVIEPLLIGAIVVTGHVQGGIGPHLLGIAGVFDGFNRIVGTGPGNHRDAASHQFDHQLHHPAMLVVGQGRTLARGAHRHYAVGTLFDMPLHQTRQRLFIQLALSKGGDQGDD